MDAEADTREAQIGPDHWGEQLGLEVLEVTPERVVARLEPGEKHQQPYGILHGGVYASIVEDVASHGAGAAAASRNQLGVVGISNSTDFLRSHSTGELRAVGEPIHVSRTQQIWQVVISRTADDKTVARGQVRFQVLDRLPFEQRDA